jgi:TolB protein
MPAFRSDERYQTVLALVDPLSGNPQVLPVPEGAYSFPQMSLDGKRLAVTTMDGKDSVVSIYDFSDPRGTLRRLTFGGNNTNPVWSRPDGKYVFFTSDRDGKNRLFRQLADGSEPDAEPLTSRETDMIPLAESADPFGKMLAFTIRRGLGGSGSIWLLPLAGNHTAQLFMGGGANASHTHAAFSPNGRWLAYASTDGRGNSPQVFVQAYPGTAHYQITKDGGTYPLWSPDRKRLFYIWDRAFVVDIRTEPSFSSGKPTPLPITIIQNARSQRNFDITPDGRLLAVVDSSGQNQMSARRNQINVVLNWFRELQERAPAK